MTMDGLRGYLQLASGLAETSRAKATQAASALLSLSSGLSSGRSGKNVQMQVQDLAEELLAAAAANRRSVIALVRSEVERAMARSPIPPDELDRARVAVAKLSADVEELRAHVLANPAVGEVASKLGLAGHVVSRPVGGFDDAGRDADVASTRADSLGDGVVVDAALMVPVDQPVAAPPRRRPPRAAITRAATRPTGEVGAGAATAPVTATKTAATKTAARKAAATKTAATKSTATTTAATKTAATKSAATKSATKKSAAAKSAAKKSAAAKSATKKTAAKKSTSKKSTAKTAAAPRSGGGA
ncbi:MAG: hypothetical protein ABJA74_06275 [Lapillicoccus sp.]